MSTNHTAKKPRGEVTENVILIPRTSIEPNPRNPRKNFNAKRLVLLAKSIELSGQLTPIDVRRMNTRGSAGKPFQLIEGERRWRATAMIDPNFKLRAIVKEVSNDDRQFIMSCIANLGREDYTHMEAARLLRDMMEIEKCTQTTLAELCAHTEFWVSQHLSLLKLDSRIQKLLEPDTPKDDRVPFSLAVDLAAAPKDKQMLMLQKVKKGKLRVGHARDYVKSQLRGMPGVDGRRQNSERPYRKLTLTLERIRQDAARIAATTTNDYKSVLVHRSRADVKFLAAQLAEASKLLLDVREKIIVAGRVAKA